jgi:hypothetical protein
MIMPAPDFHEFGAGFLFAGMENLAATGPWR